MYRFLLLNSDEEKELDAQKSLRTCCCARLAWQSVACAVVLVVASSTWADLGRWTGEAQPGGGPIAAVAVDPSSPRVLYAATYTFGVFKSTDNAATWTPSSTGLTALSVRALAVARSALATLYAGTTGGVFRSIDGGAHWTAASTGLTGLVVGTIAVDPTAPMIVYAGTDAGLFKSTDGGAGWTAADAGIAGAARISVNQ
jgi:photosystem II stability/assembly factor-like uncharacterized protein